MVPPQPPIPDTAVEHRRRPLGFGAVSSFHRGQLCFERLGLRQSLGWMLLSLLLRLDAVLRALGLENGGADIMT